MTFWAIEIIFDWILSNKSLAFGKGYLLTHFIFMYILGRTVNMYKEEIYSYINIRNCIMIYITGALLIIGLYTVVSGSTAFAYTNPINVVMSFSLFLIFENKRFYSPIINWISCSTLTVYILHIPSIINILQNIDLYILEKFKYGIYLIDIFSVIIIVFIFSVLYDKIRMAIFTAPGIIIWNWISKKLNRYSIYHE